MQKDFKEARDEAEGVVEVEVAELDMREDLTGFIFPCKFPFVL